MHKDALPPASCLCTEAEKGSFLQNYTIYITAPRLP